MQLNTKTIINWISNTYDVFKRLFIFIVGESAFVSHKIKCVGFFLILSLLCDNSHTWLSLAFFQKYYTNRYNMMISEVHKENEYFEIILNTDKLKF